MLTVRYEVAEVQAGDRVLDLGCGFGRHGYEAARRGANVVSVDYAEQELKAVRATFWHMHDAGELSFERCQGTTRADAVQLPFADHSFDRVIASEVLEHVDNDAGALRELARVLRPGGTLAVTAPAFGPERVCWALSADYHAPAVEGGHVRIYTRAELRNQMIRAGLAPYAAHRTHALHSPYWWLRCAVGPTNENHAAVRRYRQLLEWEITARPRSLATVERALAPVLGKSMVVYARKEVQP
jgi:ubiquinone/menaquinone biosynthesis C-methylase UbiE